MLVSCLLLCGVVISFKVGELDRKITTKEEAQPNLKPMKSPSYLLPTNSTVISQNASIFESGKITDCQAVVDEGPREKSSFFL